MATNIAMYDRLKVHPDIHVGGVRGRFRTPRLRLPRALRLLCRSGIMKNATRLLWENALPVQG